MENKIVKGDVVVSFEIPLDPVTKKNGGQVVRRGKFSKVLPNKPYLKYEPLAIEKIPSSAKIGIDYPVNVKALYYRKTKRRVDITNLESALLDVLVKANVLVDDCAINTKGKEPIVVSTDGSRVYIDKDNPRTEVVITRQ